MFARSTVPKNPAALAGSLAAGSLAAGIAYATLVERNAFVVRETTMPVLTPGSSPLRVLHVSDFHMMPGQRRKQAWVRELAGWDPDLVINTGDNLSHPKAVPSVVQALGDLLSVAGRCSSSGATTTSGRRPRTPPTTSSGRRTASPARRCRGRTCGRRSPSAAGWT